MYLPNGTGYTEPELVIFLLPEIGDFLTPSPVLHIILLAPPDEQRAQHLQSFVVGILAELVAFGGRDPGLHEMFDAIFVLCTKGGDMEY